MKIAGGENVIKDTSKQYISSNTENLVNVDPDIILRLPHGMPDEVKKMFQKNLSKMTFGNILKQLKKTVCMI